MCILCRSKRPRRLPHEQSSPAQTLGSWVRVSLKVWMSMCVYFVCVCVVLCVKISLKVWMSVCVYFVCVCVVLCVSSGFQTG
jgi:hypothetical protein